jgi:ATP-dependent Lon protease
MSKKLNMNVIEVKKFTKSDTPSRRSTRSVHKKRKVSFSNKDEVKEFSNDEDYIPEISSESSSEEEEDFHEDDLDIVMSDKGDSNNEKHIKELESISSFLSTQNPSVKNILSSNISFEDKSHLIQMYEVYKNMEVLTPEWLDMRNKIILYLKDAQNKNHSSELTKEIQRLEGFLTSDSIESRIIQLKTDDMTKAYILDRHKRTKYLNDDEKSKTIEQVKWMIKLPYDALYTINNKNILQQVKISLDKELYKMESVKEQILLFLNLKLQQPDVTGCNLALVGPPGVGKTLIVSTLSKVLNLPFRKIFLGSANNVDNIKGSNKVFIGAGPGIIAKTMCDLGVKNGIMYFDEINHIYDVPQIETALLQIFDPEQNSEFDDNFIEGVKIDLSSVWFISSMNSLPNNKALRDRMYVINVPDYTRDEKAHIISNYILKKVLNNYGMRENDVSINLDTAKYIVDNSIDRGGMRSVKNNVENIVKKLNFLKNSNVAMSFRNEKIKFPLKLTKEQVKSLI